jgi:DNA-binding SARP family transcriptional activator
VKRERADTWERFARAHARIARDDAAALVELQRCWDEMDAAGERVGRLCVAAAFCECMHVQRRDFRDYQRWRSRIDTWLADGLDGALRSLQPAHQLRALIGVSWLVQIKPLAGVDSVQVAQRIDSLLDQAHVDATGVSPELHLLAAAAAVRAHGHRDNIAAIEATIARATPRYEDADAVAQVHWLQATGTALTFSVPGDRGPDLLRSARERATQLGLRAVLFELCHDELFVRLGRDGPEGLEPLFEQMVQSLDPTRLYDVARRYHMSARRCLHQPEESGPAFYYAQTAIDLVERSGYPIHDAAMLYTTFAYVCARRGDVPAGLAAIEKVAAESSGEQQRQQLSICLFLRAYAMLLSEPPPQAAKLLQQAFAEADRAQWFGFRPVPEVAGRLVEAALQLGIDAAPYARKLIALRKLSPPGYSAAWPWTVRIRILGRFELIIDDAPLATDGKLPRKTLELLQLIAGSPDLTVAADRLTAALWPELEGDFARGAFRTALHRLRKLLDDPHAVVFDSASVRLDPTHVWVDSHAFERLADSVEQRLRRGEGARARFDGAEAIALYRGHLLDDQPESPWMLAARERLRSRFARLVATLGEHFERGGEAAQARQLYMKAIELDPMNEEGARRLMTLLRDAGEASAALEVYRALRQRLSIELGQAPSAQTRRLADSLRGE